jgi:hypothetical protein
MDGKFKWLRLFCGLAATAQWRCRPSSPLLSSKKEKEKRRSSPRVFRDHIGRKIARISE